MDCSVDLGDSGAHEFSVSLESRVKNKQAQQEFVAYTHTFYVVPILEEIPHNSAFVV